MLNSQFKVEVLSMRCTSSAEKLAELTLLTHLIHMAEKNTLVPMLKISRAVDLVERCAQNSGQNDTR